jgi:hypothetical protein
MVKIVTLFLVFMAVLAMFGRLRLPKLPRMTRRRDLPRPRLCKTCGRYDLQGGDCPHCGDGRS